MFYFFKTLFCSILLFCGGACHTATSQPFQEDDRFVEDRGADLTSLIFGEGLSQETEDFLANPTLAPDEGALCGHNSAGGGVYFPNVGLELEPSEDMAMGNDINFLENILQPLLFFFRANSDADVAECDIIRAHNWPKSTNILQCVNVLNVRQGENIIYNRRDKTYKRYRTQPVAGPKKHVIFDLSEILNDPKNYSFNEAVNILHKKGRTADIDLDEIVLYKDVLRVVECVRSHAITHLKHEVIERCQKFFEAMKTKAKQDQENCCAVFLANGQISQYECILLCKMLQLERDGILKKVKVNCAKYFVCDMSPARSRRLMLQYVKEHSGCSSSALLQKSLKEGWASSEITFWTTLGMLSLGGANGRVVYDPKEKVFCWDPRTDVVEVNKKLLCPIYDLKREHPHCSRHELKFMLMARGCRAVCEYRISKVVQLLIVIGVLPDSHANRLSTLGVNLSMLDLLVRDGKLRSQRDYTKALKQEVRKSDMEMAALAQRYLVNGELKEVWKHHDPHMDVGIKQEMSSKRGARVNLGFNFLGVPNLCKFFCDEADPESPPVKKPCLA